MFVFVLFSKYSEEKKFPKLGLQTLPEKMYVNPDLPTVLSDLRSFNLHATECSNLHYVFTAFSNQIKMLFRMSFMLERHLRPFQLTYASFPGLDPLSLVWSSQPSSRVSAQPLQKGRGGPALCRETVSKEQCSDRTKTTTGSAAATSGLQLFMTLLKNIVTKTDMNDIND